MPALAPLLALCNAKVKGRSLVRSMHVGCMQSGTGTAAGRGTPSDTVQYLHVEVNRARKECTTCS